jgi:hypothetical protein
MRTAFCARKRGRISERRILQPSLWPVVQDDDDNDPMESLEGMACAMAVLGTRPSPSTVDYPCPCCEKIFCIFGDVEHEYVLVIQILRLCRSNIEDTFLHHRIFFPPMMAALSHCLHPRPIRRAQHYPTTTTTPYTYNNTPSCR